MFIPELMGGCIVVCGTEVLNPEVGPFYIREAGKRRGEGCLACDPSAARKHRTQAGTERRSTVYVKALTKTTLKGKNT